MKIENKELDVDEVTIEIRIERVVEGISALTVVAFIVGLIFKLSQM